MVDILLLAQTFWCVLWYRSKTLNRVVLYTGGILASGYVATQLSTWLANTFAPPSSSVFHWVQTKLSTDIKTVSALSKFLPPEPTWSGMSHTEWIALQVIKGLLFIGITLAIYAAFVVVGYLMDALWERQHPPNTMYQRFFVTLFGFLSGAYIAVLTITFLSDLAWFRALGEIPVALQHSVVFELMQRMRGS